MEPVWKEETKSKKKKVKKAKERTENRRIGKDKIETKLIQVNEKIEQSQVLENRKKNIRQKNGGEKEVTRRDRKTKLKRQDANFCRQNVDISMKWS